MKEENAWAYFLTFRTYATFLHGDSRLSVDRHHNVFNTAKIPPNSGLKNKMKNQCSEQEFILDTEHQRTTLQSIIDSCKYFSWNLLAAHVRSNHAHVILQSSISKEKTLAKLKAYATRDLKKNHTELISRKHFWAEHGSTKLIWAAETSFSALYYVVEEQGEPMALYYDKKFYDQFDRELYRIYREILC